MKTRLMYIAVLSTAAATILSFQNCVKNGAFQTTSSSSKSPSAPAPLITPANVNTNESCARPLIANGSVSAAPSCAITCNAGYTQDLGECIQFTGQSCPVAASPAIVGAAPGCEVTCPDNYTQNNGNCIMLTRACSPASVVNGVVDASTCKISCKMDFELNGTLCVAKNARPPADFSCGVSGSLSSYNVLANVPVAAADAGKAGAYFAVGEYPAGEYYSYNGTSWSKYNGNNATGFSTSSLTNITNYPLFTNANFYGYSGAKLYVGYGVGSDISAALNDLLKNHKFGNCGGALPGPTPASFLCTNTGTVTNYNIKASVSVASEDIGKAGSYFVAGQYKGIWYTYDGKGWTPFDVSVKDANGNSIATGFSTASLANVSNYELLSNIDVSAFKGVQLYLGYGLGADVSVAFAELLAKNRFGGCGLPLP